MMLEFYVYSRFIQILGEVSEYESVEIEENYNGISKIVLRVPYTEYYKDLLKIGHIIVNKEDNKKGFIIDHFSSIKEDSDIIEVFGYSLAYWIDFRVIQKQQRFYGDATRVIENFVRYNCINSEPIRTIPFLRINPNNQEMGLYIDSTKTGGSVLEQCYNICEDINASIEVTINYQDSMFEVDIYKGTDRSINQNINPKVIFSDDFDNILSSNYFNSFFNYKNIAIVAGEGEGIQRKVLVVGEYSEGVERREIYVDARDLSSTYFNEENVEITLTEEEYNEILTQRGNEVIKQYTPIESFQSIVDDVQYRLNVDYFLGDKVTFIDDKLNVSLDVTLNSIKIYSDRKGTIFTPTFGSKLPINTL